MRFWIIPWWKCNRRILKGKRWLLFLYNFLYFLLLLRFFRDLRFALRGPERFRRFALRGHRDLPCEAREILRYLPCEAQRDFEIFALRGRWELLSLARFKFTPCEATHTFTLKTHPWIKIAQLKNQNYTHLNDTLARSSFL